MILNQAKGMCFLFGAFTLAGTSVVAARVITEQLGVFTITTISLLFAILCLLPFSINKIKKSIRFIFPMNWILILIQALFGIFLYRMFLLVGILHTSSVEAGILTGATPAFTAILARLLLRETFGRGRWTGILCTVFGILLIHGLLLPHNSFAVEHLFGNTLVLCAALCESLFNTSSRIAVVRTQAQNRQTMDPLAQTTLVSAIALLLCVIPALLEQPFQALQHLGLTQWLSLLWYGIFITALAFIFWYEGIKRCHAAIAAAFSGMVPFTSLLLSVSLLGEHAEWNQWVGGFLIVLGMVLIGFSKAQNNTEIQNREESVV